MSITRHKTPFKEHNHLDYRCAMSITRDRTPFQEHNYLDYRKEGRKEELHLFQPMPG